MSEKKAAGSLYYVVGPSGAGKDTLLRLLREHVAGMPLVIAHRYITRPHQDAAENHVALSEAEFELRARCGCFAMQWASHGYRYAVGVEIDRWLACGLDVIVSGSREYIPTATKNYPALRLIWVDAPAGL